MIIVKRTPQLAQVSASIVSLPNEPMNWPQVNVPASEYIPNPRPIACIASAIGAMPFGNLAVSTCKWPDAFRPSDQQSSCTTYVYPRSRRPRLTICWPLDNSKFSLESQPNEFHVFLFVRLDRSYRKRIQKYTYPSHLRRDSQTIVHGLHKRPR